MKRIFTRILLCLFLFVLLFVLFFSSFSEVRAEDSFFISTDDYESFRLDFANAEAIMINYINDIKYNYSLDSLSVVGYEHLSTFFKYLSIYNYIPTPFSNSNDTVLMTVFFYPEQDIVFADDIHKYCNVTCNYAIDIKKSNNKYILDCYSYSSTVMTSSACFFYRSEYLNNFLKENYYESNIKSNSDIISDALKEEGEKNRKHYEEMLWGTDDSNEDVTSLSSNSEKEDNKKKGLVKSILEGITNIFIKVFVPGDDYFKNYFDDLNNFFSDRFGFLYYPFELIIKILNNFMQIGDYDSNDEIYQPKDITSEYILPTYTYVEGLGYNHHHELVTGHSCDFTSQIHISNGESVTLKFVINQASDVSCYFRLISISSVSGNNSSYIYLNNKGSYEFTLTADCDDFMFYVSSNYIRYTAYFDFSMILTPAVPEITVGSFTYPDIPEPFSGQTLIKGGTISLNDILKTSEFKQIYDYYLLFVDFIIAFALIRLAIIKFEEVLK